MLNPDPGPTSVLAAFGPVGQTNTESLTTLVEYNTDGTLTSTQVIVGNSVTRFAIAAPVTVTDYDSNDQPTATRTLSPITSIVQFNSQGQAVSTILINDPVTTQTLYDSAGRPISTTIMNAPLTTVTYYNSNAGVVSTKIVAVTGSTRSGNSSASISKQNTSSRSSSSEDPRTASPSSSTSPSKNGGRSITKSESRVPFWVGVLGGFILAAWF